MDINTYIEVDVSMLVFLVLVALCFWPIDSTLFDEMTNLILLVSPGYTSEISLLSNNGN